MDNSLRTPVLSCAGGGKTKQRASNKVLFRIITILLTVAHHYVVNSRLTTEGGPIYVDPLSVHSIFCCCLEPGGRLASTAWF